MMRYIPYALAVAFGAAVLVAVIGTAAKEANPPDSTQPSTVPPPYRPVTSDLMNAFVQPRHIKLWLAGKDQDWVFADYERHNIGGIFARLAAAIPTYKGVSNRDLIATFATPQLAALDTAIKAKDESAFVEAYGSLTNACNGCHQATGHEWIVIKVPDSGSVPDQDFVAPTR
jgi:hypothetical protein